MILLVHDIADIPLAVSCLVKESRFQSLPTHFYLGPNKVKIKNYANTSIILWMLSGFQRDDDPSHGYNQSSVFFIRRELY